MPEAQTEGAGGWDAFRFRLLVTLAMRLIQLRDAFAVGASEAERRRYAASIAAPINLISGGRRLEARICMPAEAPFASVLILHGIGERLDYWAEVQQMLASHGIASLIFAYSGYGRSQGSITPFHLRQDVIAAYAAMRLRLPELDHHFVLGLSLGTGVAINATSALTPPPAGIILCEAFSSFRDAATAVCRALPLLRYLSRGLSLLVPDIYRTAHSVRRLGLPLLLVHSDADELFPVAMARTIFDSARLDPEASVELQVVHGFAHNEAYLSPSPGYWMPIIEFMCREAQRQGGLMKDAPKR